MNKIEIGKIVNTHGIKGELKVAFTDESFFEKDMSIFIGEMGEFKIKSFRIHKNHMLIVLDGFDNINDVLQFKSCSVYINRQEGEYYTSDLIDYEVYENEEKLGEVKEIIGSSMQELIVLDNGIMIPNVDEFVKEFDDENKIIHVELIEGLRNEI